MASHPPLPSNPAARPDPATRVRLVPTSGASDPGVHGVSGVARSRAGVFEGGDPTLLAAALAHEVANALTPIFGRRGTSVDSAREHAQRAYRACQAVLDLSRTASGDPLFHVEHAEAASCDVMEVWRSAWAEVASGASTAVSLDVHATRDLTVVVPAVVVERLLVNLASNAIRAVDSLDGASQIRVVCRGGVVDGVLDDPEAVWIHRAEPTLAVDRPWVIVELVDDGPGFTLGSEREAFRPRWRGRGPAAVPAALEARVEGAGDGGHGLGLAVCHAMAVRWGACLGLVRRAGLGPDGRGARLVLALPVFHMKTNNT